MINNQAGTVFAWRVGRNENQIPGTGSNLNQGIGLGVDATTGTRNPPAAIVILPGRGSVVTNCHHLRQVRGNNHTGHLKALAAGQVRQPPGEIPEDQEFRGGTGAPGRRF
jgi:hypothetical protein